MSDASIGGAVAPPLHRFDLDVLRSPAGHRLRFAGDGLQCTVTGRIYPIVDGNARLYDACDVPLALSREVQSFGDYVVTSLVPDLNLPQERIYAEARAVNTEFMFAALDYRDIESRRVLEIGAWRCESISRFADLGFDAWALDFFPGMMDAAARRHPGRPFHRVSTPMSVLPFQDKTIDLVFMHATLHHALPRDPAAFEWCNPLNMLDALREIRRVLTDDGALFLLGEGVYPEGLPIAERYHERRAQAGETPYESWYTMSEYESVFREAGIFPTLMSNQTELQLELIGYEDGKQIDLVKIGDLVFLHSYERLAMMAAWNVPGWGERFLPAWMTVR